MKKGIVLLLVLVAAAAMPVGTWYGPTTDFGPGTDTSHCLAVADLDKDGYLDIAVGNFGEQNVVYFGDGDGTFDTRQVPVGPANDLTQAIVVCDVNNDTWVDIVVGNDEGAVAGQNVVYLNDGDGTFDTISYPFGTGSDYTYALSFSDVNGDTRIDIAVGNLGQQNYVYLNDGTGNPYDTPANALPFGQPGPHYSDTWGLVFADMNGDTLLDLVEANHQTYNYVYIGDGAGNFGTQHQFGTEIEFTHSVAVGYINGDTILDVVEGNYQGQNRVYLGTGTGAMGAPIAFGPVDDRTQAIALTDVNGDTFLDVAVCNGGDANRYNRIYPGNGDGTFGTGYNAGSSSISWDLKFGEFNGDAQTDMCVANVGQNYVYLDTDVTFDNLGALFDAYTFFVAGDVAYCTDVLGSSKIAFGLAKGGTSENPEGRTDVILTTIEHDTGNLIIVGGPAVNPVADEFDGYFGITYIYNPGVSFQIDAEGKSIFLNLASYPERDICIVYLGEHNGRNVMLVWGFGWYGTYAGSVLIGDTQTWQDYEGNHLLMVRWIDGNADGLVQDTEITVEQFA